MNIEIRKPNWPTETQESLLKAAFEQGTRSIHAWEAWQDQINFDTVDFGSQCILPVVMKNLRRQGFTHPHFGMIKGIYRQNWYRNQILFKEVAAVLDIFAKQNIKTLVLKGGALSVLYYKDSGLRYMGDFDLLIHPQHFLDGIHKLIQLGWKGHFYQHELNETNIRYVKEVHFTSPIGMALDLHQHILFPHPDPDADHEFWASAIPLMLNHQPTLALNPTDQLFHICVHGLRWLALPSLRWIADAILLLRDEPNIDWDRLVYHAEHWQVVLTLKESLHYLADRVGASILQEALSQLDRLPITRLDQMAYRVYTLPDTPTTNIRRRIFFYQRFFSPGTGLLQHLWGLPHFLQRSWGLPSIFHLPLFFTSKAFRLGIRIIRSTIKSAKTTILRC